MVALAALPKEEVLKIAAIAERGSEHPLAQAIIKASADVPEPKEFSALSGRGIKAQYEGKTILVGNELLMAENNLDITPYEKDYEDLQNQAKTVVFTAYNGKIIGIIALADTLKDYVKEAITELKKMKKEIIMITGDNEKTAKAIASSIGIDSYFAKVLPEKKRS